MDNRLGTALTRSRVSKPVRVEPSRQSLTQNAAPVSSPQPTNLECGATIQRTNYLIMIRRSTLEPIDSDATTQKDLTNYGQNRSRRFLLYLRNSKAKEHQEEAAYSWHPLYWGVKVRSYQADTSSQNCWQGPSRASGICIRCGLLPCKYVGVCQNWLAQSQGCSRVCTTSSQAYWKCLSPHFCRAMVQSHHLSKQRTGHPGCCWRNI